MAEYPDAFGVDIVDGYDARAFFRHSIETFDLVIHCAAVVGGRKVIDGSPAFQLVNFELDAAMFAWAQRRVGHVVYISSSAAYPVLYQKRSGHEKLNESLVSHTAPNPPDALYGWSKFIGERMAQELSVPSTIIRPFSGYGSDQGDDYPFRAILNRAMRREDPLRVWGSGQQVRDFVHVDDIVGATKKFLADNVRYPTNIGTGVPTSMKMYAEMCAQAVGYEPEIQMMGNNEGVEYRVADVTCMNTHYTAQVSLAEGIERAIFDTHASS